MNYKVSEKNYCDVVEDLMPLYIDNVCSYTSKILVEEHLKKCEACRVKYNAQTSHFTTDNDINRNREIKDGIRRFKIHERSMVMSIAAINFKLYKKREWIFGVIALITAVADYVIFSSTTGLWHPGWLIIFASLPLYIILQKMVPKSFGN